MRLAKSPRYRVARFEACEPRIYLSLSASVDPAGQYDFRLDWATLVDDSPQVQASPDTVAAAGTGLSSADDWLGLEAAAKRYGLTGAGQTVVLIDSGIAYGHTALGGGYGSGYRVVGGYDFAESDGDPHDDPLYGSHGTHVAGILAGNDPNGANGGYNGIAPGVDLVALRVFNDSGFGRFDWVEQALAWVDQHQNDFEHPITTVNLSLGTHYNGDAPPAWATLEDELAALAADGIVVTAAAGNGYSSFAQPGLSYPAASPHVLPAASIDADGELSSFSQRSSRAIAAPGRAVVSSVPDYMGNHNGLDDDYAAYTGTSMAAPFLAGAAVLVREAYALAGSEDVGAAEIGALLHNTADTLTDAVTGSVYRRLNIERALDAVMPKETPAPPVDKPEMPTESEPASSSPGQEQSLPELPEETEPAPEPEPDPDHTLTVTDDQALLVASEGDDQISFHAGATPILVVGATRYELSRSVRDVRIVAGAGHDTVQLHGTDGTDLAVLSPSGAVFRGGNAATGGRWMVTVEDAEAVEVDGGGGRDLARLTDSAGDDTLRATPEECALTGPGYRLAVRGFEQVHAYALAGGADTAQFVLDPADTFQSNWLHAYQRGRSYLNRAKYFEYVEFVRAGVDSDTAAVGVAPEGSNAAVGPDGAKPDDRRAPNSVPVVSPGAGNHADARARATPGGDAAARAAAVDWLFRLQATERADRLRASSGGEAEQEDWSPDVVSRGAWDAVEELAEGRFGGQPRVASRPLLRELHADLSSL